MALFFQILGAIVFGIIVLLVLGWFWVRWQFRKLGRMAEQMMGGLVPPMSLELQPISTVKWKEAIARDQAEALKGEGFLPVGDFTIPKLPNAQLIGFVDPQRHAYGAVIEHPAGVWTDLFRAYEDDRTLTVTNAATLTEKTPPWKTRVQRSGATVPELVRELDSHLLEGNPVPVSEDDFKEVFEAYYRREMQWQFSSGDLAQVKAEDWELVQSMTNVEADEESMDYLRSHSRPRRLEALESDLREAFRTSGTLPATEWEEVQHRLIYIHDELSPDEVGQIVEDAAGWLFDEDAISEAEDAEVERPRELFRHLIAALGVQDEFRLLGQLGEPIPADVYLGPEEDGEDR
jgi:hypothetical protein